MKAKRSSVSVWLIVVGALVSSAGAQSVLTDVALAGDGVLVINGRQAPPMPSHAWVMPPVIVPREAVARSTGKPAGLHSAETVVRPIKSVTSVLLAEIATRLNVRPRTVMPLWKYIPKRDWRYRPPKRQPFRPITRANYKPKQSFAYRTRHN